MTDEMWGAPATNRFGFDPARPRWPQIASMVAQLGYIFLGPGIFLFAADRYPFLIQDRTLYALGLGGIALFFAGSFLLFGESAFPRGMPWPRKLLFRAGFGMCTTGLVLGVALIANGYDTPLTTRDVAVVCKRATLQRDASRRTYYVGVRAWRDSRTVVELAAPRQIYDRLHVPAVRVDTPQADLDAMAATDVVRLVVGEGRLGWEWLQKIELP